MTPDVCVIVPTIREYSVVSSYVANARDHGFPTDRLFFCIVTEDHCETEEMRELLTSLEVSGRVFDATARRRWFDAHEIGRYSHLIPERSHAQTSFGLLYLWANEFDYGVFLDDDTNPVEGTDFFGTHLRNLTHSDPIDAVGTDTKWVNVLEQTGTGLYPRGFPYGAMNESVTREPVDSPEVVVSQGLWTAVPDLDAVRILMDGDLNGRSTTRLAPEDYSHSFVVSPGHYLTVCSMNLAFRRSIIPAFYQFPMDDNPWGVSRFDDIWSGIVLKRACDVMDTWIKTGYPLCRHEKAPRSTFDDLAAETAGLAINEHFWRIVDGTDCSADSYAGVASAVADRLEDGDWTDLRNGGFLNHAGGYLNDWIDCLDALATHPVPASDD